MKIEIGRSSSKRFYWFPKWLNSITWKPGAPKIYKWGKWHVAIYQPILQNNKVLDK